ncbi:mitotic apparatus protein p62-like [Papaver somniferum]|uniref:mitotic apparatus protein p62-like n=1 Tax=Papaver somniferum TaxID=3469 RepID=UPI000E6FF812|nr:mitotic apparatus protein p62-like [Papaver somniferum]
MTKSQKIEGTFSSPSQASQTVSAAKSNIKTPKSEMFDNSLPSDTKSDIKIPKTEPAAKHDFPENNQTIAALSDPKSDIKTPRSKRGKDSLTPLKRKFGESSCHRIEEEHGATDDEENSNTADDEEEHGSTDSDNNEDHGSTDEDEDEDHGSTDEDEDADEEEEDGSTDEDDDEDEELVTSTMLLMMAFVLTTAMHVFSFRP